MFSTLQNMLSSTSPTAQTFDSMVGGIALSIIAKQHDGEYSSQPNYVSDSMVKAQVLLQPINKALTWLFFIKTHDFLYRPSKSH